MTSFCSVVRSGEKFAKVSGRNDSMNEENGTQEEWKPKIFVEKTSIVWIQTFYGMWMLGQERGRAERDVNIIKDCFKERKIFSVGRFSFASATGIENLDANLPRESRMCREYSLTYAMHVDKLICWMRLQANGRAIVDKRAYIKKTKPEIIMSALHICSDDMIWTHSFCAL